MNLQQDYYWQIDASRLRLGGCNLLNVTIRNHTTEEIPIIN